MKASKERSGSKLSHAYLYVFENVYMAYFIFICVVKILEASTVLQFNETLKNCWTNYSCGCCEFPTTYSISCGCFFVYVVVEKKREKRVTALLKLKQEYISLIEILKFQSCF